MRALSDIALAISTICRTETGASAMSAGDVERDAKFGEQRLGVAPRAAASRSARIAYGARPAKMFSPMLTVPVSESS